MSNISYHGTNLKNANIMVGPPSKVDVNVGKGELGKGFYTGSSIAIAAIWARQRYGNKAVVIEFDIPKQRFVQLKGHLIKTKAEVQRNWKVLKANNETSTYIFEHDYVIAPFSTIENTGYQYKFESEKAEDELNASQKQIYTCES